MRVKKMFLITLFSLQMLSIIYWYIWGNKGILHIMNCQKENVDLKLEILSLRQEIALLENDIKTWHADSYYLEKVAREELQLAHSDDIIFVSSNKKES